MRPVIGVTPCISYADDPQREFSKKAEIHYIQLQYMDFVRSGGGLPVILPLLREPEEAAGFAEALDGFILTGGAPDVDPALYGQENTHAYGVDPLRDKAEIMLIHAARRAGKPLLCICRGIQVLNTALGGTLYQNLPTMVENCLNHPMDAEKKESFHTVTFPRASFLTDIFSAGAEVRVNSSHHQAIHRPGEGLTVIAQAADGVIEAVQNFDDYFTVGIQWHPERMAYEPGMVAIAKHFVEAARTR